MIVPYGNSVCNMYFCHVHRFWNIGVNVQGSVVVISVFCFSFVTKERTGLRRTEIVVAAKSLSTSPGRVSNTKFRKSGHNSIVPLKYKSVNST